ncbi:MAG: cytochrome c5 family protein [Marinicellaceae bacterium]
MKDQDSIFFKNFSIMLIALLVITIVLILFGKVLHEKLLGRDALSEDRTAVAQTIKPVAMVNTGGAVIAEVKPEVMVAFEGSLDGAMIYQNVCAACHTTGAGGAPKLEAAAWTSRVETGMEKMVSNAILGYQGELGLMPAKGGRADLSDEQVKATVEFMTSQL